MDPNTRAQVESAVADLKAVLDKGDKDTIEAKTKALTQVSHKLAEQMYAHANQSQGEGGGPEFGRSGEAQGTKNDDDVVDAEFEEVK